MAKDTMDRPPVFVSGGKRLNFTRRDEYYADAFHTDFSGYGKEHGCYPSATWEELCAMAALIVAHPAYVEPSEPSTYYPPMIEDEDG